MRSASCAANRRQFVSDSTRVYLRDCYDHAVQLIDLLESYRDIAGDVRDFYLSSISNRMNEIMKTLTVIATIFLPLSFIAGVYGMNFDTNASPWNMPELKWRFGYLFALAMMAAVAIGMLWLFKRRGWLGSRSVIPPTTPRLRRRLPQNEQLSHLCQLSREIERNSKPPHGSAATAPCPLP